MEVYASADERECVPFNFSNINDGSHDSNLPQFINHLPFDLEQVMVCQN